MKRNETKFLAAFLSSAGLVPWIGEIGLKPSAARKKKPMHRSRCRARDGWIRVWKCNEYGCESFVLALFYEQLSKITTCSKRKQVLLFRKNERPTPFKTFGEFSSRIALRIRAQWWGNLSYLYDGPSFSEPLKTIYHTRRESGPGETRWKSGIIDPQSRWFSSLCWYIPWGSASPNRKPARFFFFLPPSVAPVVGLQNEAELRHSKGR